MAFGALKKKWILFPLLDGQEFDELALHSGWQPKNSDYNRILTDINIYHLKNIDPKNRLQRAKMYEKLDPRHDFQPIGYDYLADESGLIVERITPDREYFPPYSESYNLVQHF
jgi:hypothetical protein